MESDEEKKDLKDERSQEEHTLTTNRVEGERRGNT